MGHPLNDFKVINRFLTAKAARNDKVWRLIQPASGAAIIEIALNLWAEDRARETFWRCREFA
jgi:hypothetical protein